MREACPADVRGQAEVADGIRRAAEGERRTLRTASNGEVTEKEMRLQKT